VSGYPASYFEDYSGTGQSYLDAPHWPRVFAGIAEHLTEQFHPRTVLDAGCATGYLVEAFRDLGVEAEGVDASEWAIGHCRIGAVGHVRCRSLAAPLFGHFDLLTCIEVLEHMPESEAREAVGHLCHASDNIIFSSSPSDFAEPTHVNVQPQSYWERAFAGHGFSRDPDFDGGFIVEWCMRFTRSLS
jgi:predicted TPR repeat methyltransferase